MPWSLRSLRRSSGRLAILALSTSVAVAVSACQDSSGPGSSTVTVSITEPADGGRFLDGGNVQLSAIVNSTVSIDSLVWRSSLDGRLGAGAAIVAPTLSVGEHVISATAFASGVRDSATVSIRMETLPDVSISQPASESTFSPFEAVEFVGQATDGDGGNVTLEWRSSIDGVLGVGPGVNVPALTLGPHTVWLVAIDDEGQSDSASVDLTIVDFALAFDGEQDGATVPHHPDFNLASTWTIELWVHPFVTAAEEQQLVSKWGAQSLNRSFQVFIEDSDALGFRLWNEGGGRGVGRLGTITENEWQHVAVTFDDGTVRLIHDGLEVETSQGFMEPQPTEVGLSLGRLLNEDGTAVAHFDGLIDEVRIWNVVRTPTQIRDSRFVRMSGTETGLVAYWRMGEGGGDVVSDETGRGHTLQLGDVAGPDAANPAWHWPGQVVR